MSSTLSADARLYLPISDQQLSPVLDGGVELDRAIATLEVPQLASLIVLHSLPTLALEQASHAESMLVRAIELANEQTAGGDLSEFRRGLSAGLDRARVKAGHALMDDYGIALLEHELVGWRSYLTETHGWDREFCERHRQQLRKRLQQVVLPSGAECLLTSEQSGIYRTVVAQSDDHLHVQGYAGTGKSLLIHALLDLLGGEARRILLLAERPRQLRALMAGIEGMSQVEGMTFAQLAAQITPTDLISRGQRGRYFDNEARNPMYDDVMVRHLGVHPIGDFSAIQIVKLARRTVATFCATADDEIADKHLVHDIGDAQVRQVVLHHATQLWTATISPASSEFRPPLRAFHRIKLAALHRWRIPAKYTHVLLDESHDLSKPLLQILDVSPQAAISFGDEYQHLRGRAHSRGRAIRRSVITHSVRSAKAIETIANPLIQAHPGETKAPFLGHRKFRAEVSYYTAAEIPPRPVTILVQDRWELFDWVERLARARLSIRPLSDFARLAQWVNDCIELYSHGTPARDGSLFRFHSWDQVRAAFGRNRGFRKVDELLQSGYRREHWARTADYVDPAATEGYALGLIEDVRNLEFPDVLVAPNVVGDLWTDTPGARATASSLVYVAVTRAQHRLLVPQGLRDWIEDRGGVARAAR